MKEIIDLRLPEKWAQEHLGDIGQKLTVLTRRIVINVKHPDFPALKAKIIERNLNYPMAYSSAIYYRSYTKKELEAAELLSIEFTSWFEPAGEECGTQYDLSQCCPYCGAGRRQLSNLYLDARTIPKKKDISSTIGQEWIISQRFADLLDEHGISGANLQPIYHRPAQTEDIEVDGYIIKAPKSRQAEGSLIANWYQLQINAAELLALAPPTVYGKDALDEDVEQKYVCPLGHTLGLNRLSELWISRDSWDGSDMAVTKQMKGWRQGLLVPTPCLVVSQKLYRLLREQKMRGFTVEVAHMI